MLERQTPTIELTTLQDAVSSFRVDIDAILEMSGTEPDNVPIAIEEDTMMELCSILLLICNLIHAVMQKGTVMAIQMRQNMMLVHR